MRSAPSAPSALSGMRRLRRRQAGVAAVELALLLPILVAFLAIGFFTASILWHYMMVQKAAQDAARYLSTVPAWEMTTQASALAAGNQAQDIARRELADMSPGATVSALGTYCDEVNCGMKFAYTLPTTVRVYLEISVKDPTGLIDTGFGGWPIVANYTLRYAGK